MTKQTRQRELARLRARRDAERYRARRKRALLTYGAMSVVVLVLVGIGGTLLANRPKHKAAAATTTTTTTPPLTGARIDAPTAPATVACGGTLPARHKHPTFKKAPTTRLDPAKTYVVTLKTSCGSFKIQLDPKAAPITSASFAFLVKQGFYDSTWFHRIAPGFVIQGGDPKGAGEGGPGYKLKDELPKGKDPYKKYTIAMANNGANTNGSQFFVAIANLSSKTLPSKYTLFGKVISGQAAIDKIAAIPVGGQRNDTPTQAAWIEQATVQVS